MTFDRLDRSTWGDLLTLDQVAAIWQRTPEAIRKAIQQHKFQPVPAEGTSPRRWRKVDVLRFLDGGHRMSLRRAS